MRITQTNGNSRNGIKGSRLSIYTDDGVLVDRFVVPSRNARAYCDRHPTGRYALRLDRAWCVACAAALHEDKRPAERTEGAA